MSIHKTLYAAREKLQRCYKAVHGLYKESPMIVAVVLAVIVILVLLGLLLNKCFTYFAGARVAVVLDLIVVWLLIRFIVRAMVFPGSLKLVQRNTEATYRVEIARQYLQHLKQLHAFLRHTAKHSAGVPRGLTAEGVLRGYSVVECISKGFRIQQHDQVRLSTEQAHLFALSAGLESWLSGVKVQKRTEGESLSALESGSAAKPLVEWLREQTNESARAGSYFSQQTMLLGVELVDGAHDSQRQIGHMDQLITMFNDLRAPKAKWWENTMRFLRVPTVGSLHQLRAELQMRYSGVQCWVPSGRGNRLDAMFLPCDPDATSGPAVEPADAGDSEDTPLQNLGAAGLTFSGPTLLWCNPNAGYYETMVYQSNILNFYLDRGCNVFLFNYSGFGRSRGLPTTSKVAEDSDSIIEFLKSKGITQVGIHGRSIGGVAACHLARRHPDIVKFMVTDRGFSTLGATAKYTYGAWAEKGLAAGAMWADNVANFLAAPCHKVMVCDPKDGIIPDIASLRTAAALQAVSRMSPEERLHIDDARLLKLYEAWQFFSALFSTCEEEDGTARAGKPARQPTITTPTSTAASSDVRSKVGDSNAELTPVGKKSSIAAPSERIDEEWLRAHSSVLREAIGPFIDQVRVALDIVTEHLDAGGLSLGDVLGEMPSNPSYALRCWLANLQVWGSIGDLREASDNSPLMGASCQDGISDFEIECFLRKSDVSYSSRREVSKKRLDELDQTLSASAVANYNRQLARAQVLLVRREFRRRLSALQQSFRSGAGSDAAQSAEAGQLRLAVLQHLGEVEAFVTTIGRFFKCVDLMLPYSIQASKDPDAGASEVPALSESSDEKEVDGFIRLSSQRQNMSGEGAEAVIPRPIIDHSVYGYVVHTDCGHNGVLDDTEFRLIGLHMRVARFGRAYAVSP